MSSRCFAEGVHVTPAGPTWTQNPAAFAWPDSSHWDNLLEHSSPLLVSSQLDYHTWTLLPGDLMGTWDLPLHWAHQAKVGKKAQDRQSRARGSQCSLVSLCQTVCSRRKGTATLSTLSSFAMSLPSPPLLIYQSSTSIFLCTFQFPA